MEPKKPDLTKLPRPDFRFITPQEMAVQLARAKLPLSERVKQP